MSPILLRPIREQVDHDRVIRQLQARWRRRYAVAVNIGTAQETTIRVAGVAVSPDLVLTNTEGGRRLHAVVEVETAESINHLEAMAQWARFAKARAAFYLYVPAGAADVAHRLCRAQGINVTEIWTYYMVGDQFRFSMAHRSEAAKRAARARKAAGTAEKKTAASATSGKATSTTGTKPPTENEKTTAGKAAGATTRPTRSSAARAPSAATTKKRARSGAAATKTATTKGRTSAKRRGS